VAAIDGEHFEELMADLDAAVLEVISAFDREPALWDRGLPGKWTAGQHELHLVRTLEATAQPLLTNARELQAGGDVPPCPRRGLLEFLWVFMVIRRGKLPRGGRTPQRFDPRSQGDAKLELVDREWGAQAIQKSVDAHRAVGARLTPEQRDRLWIPNPFHDRWHYTFPEILRMHAVHVRHHAKLIQEIAVTAPAR